MEIRNNFYNTSKQPHFNGSVSTQLKQLVRQAAHSELNVAGRNANSNRMAVDTDILNNIKNRTIAIINALNEFTTKLHPNTQMDIITTLPPQKIGGDVKLLFNNTCYKTLISIPIKSCENNFALNRIDIYEHITKGLKKINPKDIDKKILNNAITDIKNCTKGLHIPPNYNKKVSFANNFAKEIGVKIDIHTNTYNKALKLKQEQDNINNNNKLLSSVYREICHNIKI